MNRSNAIEPLPQLLHDLLCDPFRMTGYLPPRVRIDQDNDPEERDCQPGFQKTWEPEK